MSASTVKVTRAKSHASRLLDSLSTMLQEEILLDCTLVCDGQIIRAHKVILSSSSDYFNKAFTSFSSTCQSTAIIIKDMPFHHLKAIIDYIYTGDLSIDVTNLTSFIQSADSLKVDSLLQHLNTLTDGVSLKSHPQAPSSPSPNQSSHHQHVSHHYPQHQSSLQVAEADQDRYQTVQGKVLKSISPTSTSPASLLSSNSLRNLQMILPLNQSTSSSPDLHSSTLAQALTNIVTLPVRKEKHQRNHLNASLVTNDDDSNHSVASDSDNLKSVKRVSVAGHAASSAVSASAASLNHRNSHRTDGLMLQNNSDIWRACDLDELDDDRRSPVDLSASTNKSYPPGSSEHGKNGHTKLQHPPKARHFYANGNFLKNHRSTVNLTLSNDSISPPSSQSPTTVSYDQSNATNHHRIFSSSNHRLSLTSDNLSSMKSDGDQIELTSSHRRDSLSSGENITLKRGRGRPPRYSIDDENWHSRLRTMQCNEIDNDTQSLKVDRDASMNGGSHHVTNSSSVSNNSSNINLNHISHIANTEKNNNSGSSSISPVSSLSSSKRIKLSFDTSAGSLRGRKPKLDYSTTSREVSGKNKCPHCPQVYYSTQAMSDHINNVHSKNRFKYVCQTCYKEFSWNISLKKHVRKAHGEESMATSISQKMIH